MTTVTLEQVMMGWAKLNQPNIKLKLERVKKVWRISLLEEWQSVDDAGNSFHSSDLDKQVSWAIEELKKWDGARRMAWNMWDFDDKRQAQKFSTYYYIVWG